MSPRRPVQTDAAPGAIGPYSQAIVDNGLVLTAGQLGVDPETGELAGETAAEQAAQAMRNLGAVLDAAGSGWDRVLKTTIFLVDMADFESVNDEYVKHLTPPFPARSTFAVAALPRGGRVEIECIATLGTS
jgi:2-iminobutanoate/2-iminopropanoate deaminase